MRILSVRKRGKQGAAPEEKPARRRRFSGEPIGCRLLSLAALDRSLDLRVGHIDRSVQMQERCDEFGRSRGLDTQEQCRARRLVWFQVHFHREKLDKSTIANCAANAIRARREARADRQSFPRFASGSDCRELSGVALTAPSAISLFGLQETFAMTFDAFPTVDSSRRQFLQPTRRGGRGGWRCRSGRCRARE